MEMYANEGIPAYVCVEKMYLWVLATLCSSDFFLINKKKCCTDDGFYFVWEHKHENIMLTGNKFTSYC